jgi:tetratricopeptide (TPR) repeat protein
VHRRPHRPAALAADLWPGEPALLDEVPAGLLEERADGLLALDPAVAVDLDEAMALVRTLADGAGRPDGVPADLPRARTLLAADILPGDPAPWLAVERERFRQIRLNALEELSAALSTAGRHAEAVAVAEDAVRTAPSRESARRALIEAHLAQGEIAEAVAQYDEYQDLLRSSVGAPLGSGLDGAFGLEGLLPPVPAWPVLRVRRSMQRVGMSPPVFRTARGGARRLVAGGSVPGTTR